MMKLFLSQRARQHLNSENIRQLFNDELLTHEELEALSLNTYFALNNSNICQLYREKKIDLEYLKTISRNVMDALKINNIFELFRDGTIDLTHLEGLSSKACRTLQQSKRICRLFSQRAIDSSYMLSFSDEVWDLLQNDNIRREIAFSRIAVSNLNAMAACSDDEDALENIDFSKENVLRRLAAYSESSMVALSSEEVNVYDNVIQKYISAPLRDAHHVIQEMLSDFADRYDDNPAKIKRDSSEELMLPLAWETFCEMNLSVREKREALIAYYQHIVHTAWRYFHTPNPWAENNLLSEAPHDYRFNDIERQNSDSGDCTVMIAAFWLAVNDENARPTDGFSVRSRIAFFVNEIAMIARAHNWDSYRDMADGREEQYDDLQGDKPSCYAGVKRRLYHAVQGHPLFQFVLTDITLEQEVMFFVNVHFNEVVTSQNVKDLSDALYTFLTECDENSIDVLKGVDIMPDAIESFQQFLRQKYGDQYANNSVLQDYIANRLALADNEAHAIKFAEQFRSVIVSFSQLVSTCHG